MEEEVREPAEQSPEKQVDKQQEPPSPGKQSPESIPQHESEIQNAAPSNLDQPATPVDELIDREQAKTEVNGPPLAYPGSPVFRFEARA